MSEEELLVRLGIRIKMIRLERKMTQNSLAMECEFEKASMSRIESGQSNPTVRTLHKICTALEIPIAELFID